MTVYAGRLAALAAAGAIAVSGCGEPRSGAVAETGPCAQVIPLAQANAGNRARLVQVTALKQGDLRAVLVALGVRPQAHPRTSSSPRERLPRPMRTGARPMSLPGGQAVGGRLPRRLPRKSCVLVYGGSFRAATAAAGPAKRYLILVISVRHPTLLRSVVVNHLPPAVAHRG